MPTRKRKSGTRKRTKRQSGRGIRDVMRKAHSFVKSNKLVSRALRHRGHTIAADVASQLGYGSLFRTRPLVVSMTGGRRRKTRRRVVPTIMSLTSLPKRRRANPVKVRSRRVARSVMAPTTSVLARRALGGQRGTGFIGKTLGGLAGGLLGGLLPF